MIVEKNTIIIWVNLLSFVKLIFNIPPRYPITPNAIADVPKFLPKNTSRRSPKEYSEGQPYFTT